VLKPRAQWRRSRGGTRRGRPSGSSRRCGRSGDDRISYGGARGRAEPRAAAPRHLQRLDHADQGAPRHAVDRHPHAGRHQDHGQRSADDRAAGPRGRGGGGAGARHAQRVRRAGRRRLLPRLRAQARPAGALRPDRRRRQHDGHDRGRRRQPVDDVEGASATASTSATPATIARTSGAAPGAVAAARRPRPDPDGGDRRRRADPGAVDDPRRERPVGRLRLRRLRHSKVDVGGYVDPRPRRRSRRR
jgi:hypothetical protein